jgi:phosphatidylglycerophosphate synthase
MTRKPADTAAVSDVSPPSRRALATRDAGWARALARRLARAGVRPNSVSVAGLVCAAAAGAGFCVAPDLASNVRAPALLVAAAAIQLRLLCNLIDGMLAVEEGFSSKTGNIYNDLPDRISDVLILVGAGYSARDLAFAPALGWCAAVLAVLTAYVRVLGGALGVTQHFVGPMAKQHRMFTLTIATLLSALDAMLGMPPRALPIGLGVIVAGSIVTACRRTARIVNEVNAQ